MDTKPIKYIDGCFCPQWYLLELKETWI